MVAHLKDYIQVFPVVLQLRALICIQDILKDKGMKAVTVSKFPYKLYLMYAVHIDPGNGWFVFEEKALIYRSHRLFEETPFVIINDCDVDFLIDPFSDMHQCPWWQAALYRSLLAMSPHSHLSLSLFLTGAIIDKVVTHLFSAQRRKGKVNNFNVVKSPSPRRCVY